MTSSYGRRSFLKNNVVFDDVIDGSSFAHNFLFFVNQNHNIPKSKCLRCKTRQVFSEVASTNFKIGKFSLILTNSKFQGLVANKFDSKSS